MTNTTCSIDECTKGGRLVKGTCMMHYERMRRYGSPAEPHLARAEGRFWSKVDKTETCWNWTGPTKQGGYGKFAIGRAEQWLAHRYAWTLMVGEIGEDMALDHICHNTSCVNPEHLREVTNKQNHEHLRGAYSTSKSKIRGVSWDRSRRLWRATLTHNYKHITVGRFDQLEDAEAAITAKRLELFTHNNLDRAA